MTTIVPPSTFDTSRPSFGGIIRVCSTVGQFATALSICADGDIIALTPGTNFDGQFTLRNRGTSGIVEIRTNINNEGVDGAASSTITDAVLNSVCPEGSRMTPAKASTLNLARLRADQGNGLIVSALGASGYRLTALSATVTSGLSSSNALIRFGDTTLTLDSQASYDLIMDRCYVYGDFNKAVTRGVTLCGPRQAIIDSHIAPFYNDGADSQAWAIIGYKGPYMFINNYCEGWSETFLVGGGNSGIDPANINGVISDVTIRYNYFSKDPTAVGTRLNCKNGVEFKTGRRMLMEYNIVEHTIPQGQVGLLISIKSTEQWSGGPHRTLEGVSDLEVRYNWFRQGARGIGIAANPDAFLGEQSIPVHLVKIHNNLISDVNTDPVWHDGGGTGGVCLSLFNDMSDITIEHNTFVNVDIPAVAGALLDATTPSPGLITFQSNIIQHGYYGWINGDGGYANGSATINAAWPSHIWLKNILVNVYGAATVFPNPTVDTIDKASDSVVGYRNLSTLDVKLTSGPGVAGGHDGFDIGIIDVDSFFSSLAGVTNGELLTITGGGSFFF